MTEGSRPILPASRVAARMDATQDNNVSVLYRVNQRIWKAMQTGEAKLTVNDLVLQRVVAYPIQDRIQSPDEVVGESAPLLSSFQLIRSATEAPL
jgi:hypothetical protein